MTGAKLVGAVEVRVGYRDEPSIGPHLMVDRGLRGGKLDTVLLSRENLFALIESAARALRSFEPVSVAARPTREKEDGS